LTAADVDQLTKTTQEKMLKALLELADQERDEIESNVKKGTSTAVEI
jgi:lysophosphatidate acyltransferase